MNKRAIIVHGWDGTPDEGWFPWLKRELEQRGFAVTVPPLPNPGVPRIETWVPALAAAVGTPDRETFFIGHSMGCQTIARYLERLPGDSDVGGAVFVAGFFKHLTGLEDDPVAREIDRHWLGTPIDLAAVRKHLAGSVAIFSDDDPFVPLDNADDFREELGSRIIVEHGMNHFTDDHGVTELPVALESVLSLMKEPT